MRRLCSHEQNFCGQLFKYIVMTGGICCLLTSSVAGRETPETVARTVITHLANEEFDAAVDNFEPKLRAGIPASKMARIWNTLEDQNGKFEKQLTAQQQVAQGYTVVVVDCQFAKSIVSLQIAVGATGRIGGFYVAQVKPKGQAADSSSESPVAGQSPTAGATKTEAKSTTTPTTSTAPQGTAVADTKAASDKVTEKAVQIGSDQNTLPGTLTLPKGAGPFPAVVLIHGSGPHDRDETIGPNKPFRDLADGLAGKGVAVLRYEKRSKAAPETLPIDTLTVKEEVIDDAAAAIDLLAKTQGVDPKRIFVLGHSLGGSLVPRIAKSGKPVAGYIVLAGSARPLEDVLLEQVTYIYSLDGLTDKEQANLEALKKQVAKVKSPALSKDTPVAELPLGVPGSYWLDLRDYKPADAAKEIRQRMLILQGGRDYQVTDADYQLWKKALADKKNVEFKLYEKLNHLFIEGEGKSTPKDLEKAGHVAQVVIDDIAEWVNKKPIPAKSPAKTPAKTPAK